MNKAIASLLILFLLAGSLPVTGSAATNQNLEWGVEVGDRFDYHFQSNEEESECYLIVDSLPPIRDDILEIQYISYFNVTPGYTLYYANGTMAGWLMLDLTQLIIPTGNWSLWSALLDDYATSQGYLYHSINITETATSWTWTRFYFVETKLNQLTTATFRKSDGVLNHYQHIKYTTGGDKEFEFQITQRSFLTMASPYLLAVGYGLIIVVAVILYKRK